MNTERLKTIIIESWSDKFNFTALVLNNLQTRVAQVINTNVCKHKRLIEASCDGS